MVRKSEVGAVGGPNFACDDPFGAKCADVAFFTKFMTAGTRYGAQPKENWSQLPIAG